MPLDQDAHGIGDLTIALNSLYESKYGEVLIDESTGDINNTFTGSSSGAEVTPMHVDLVESTTQQTIPAGATERFEFDRYINEHLANPTYNAIGGMDFTNNEWVCPSDGLYLFWFKARSFGMADGTENEAVMRFDPSNSFDGTGNVLSEQYNVASGQYEYFFLFQIALGLGNDTAWVDLGNFDGTNSVDISDGVLYSHFGVMQLVDNPSWG